MAVEGQERSSNAIVKERFDIQAKQFDDWHITGDEELLCSFFRFAGFAESDTLLDVACGTGRFSVYAAERIKSVCGADISEKMIGVAREHAARLGLLNIEFFTLEGESLPFPDGEFSVVTSKAAFHHMERYEQVFREMTRCCRTDGTVCIQDIVAYDRPEVDQYFERLELAIDSSHYRSLQKREMFELFKRGPLQVMRLFEKESLLDLEHYVGHAVQADNDRREVNHLIEHGLRNPVTAPYFVRQNNRLYFRRRVFVIAGKRLS